MVLLCVAKEDGGWCPSGWLLQGVRPVRNPLYAAEARLMGEQQPIAVNKDLSFLCWTVVESNGFSYCIGLVLPNCADGSD